jgi:hypothetical protein
LGANCAIFILNTAKFSAQISAAGPGSFWMLLNIKTYQLLLDGSSNHQGIFGAN